METGRGRAGILQQHTEINRKKDGIYFTLKGRRENYQHAPLDEKKIHSKNQHVRLRKHKEWPLTPGDVPARTWRGWRCPSPSGGRRTLGGRTRTGCSGESSSASPWGRFAAAASQCQESRTPSCCRRGLKRERRVGGEHQRPSAKTSSIREERPEAASALHFYIRINRIKKTQFLE